MRIATSDQNCPVKQQESDRVIQSSNRRGSKLSPARAESLRGIVEQRGVGRITSKLEALSTLVGAIEPKDGSIGKKDTFNHTTTLGHGIHLPNRGSSFGGNHTTTSLSGGNNVLVRSTTTNHNLRVPLSGTGKGQQDATTGIGVGTICSRKIRQGLGDRIGANIEDLRCLGREDE